MPRSFSLDHRDLYATLTGFSFARARVVQECYASFPFLLSFRSDDMGERELGGSGTVTAPFSHLAHRLSCVIFSLRDGMPFFFLHGVCRSFPGILFENWLLPSPDVGGAHIQRILRKTEY